jgi:hypothetical protein
MRFPFFGLQSFWCLNQEKHKVDSGVKTVCNFGVAASLPFFDIKLLFHLSSAFEGLR